MMPSSSLLLAYILAVMVSMGAVVGAVAGAGAAAFFKNGVSHVGWDATLGAAGLLGTLIVFTFLPWPRNTVAIVLRGSIVGSSTMNSFQHPWPVGWAVAVLIPVGHEIRRRFRRR
jgi:hypothetical protein